MKVGSVCSCETCKGACRHKPGWFLPHEIKPLATALGVSERTLFETKLAVDWWEEDKPVFVLAPALKGQKSGQEYPADPRGECVFYVDGLCEIHEVGKPYECKEYNHTEKGQEPDIRHEKVYRAWTDNQNIIIDLLGREPESQAFHSEYLKIGFKDLLKFY